MCFDINKTFFKKNIKSLLFFLLLTLIASLLIIARGFFKRNISAFNMAGTAMGTFINQTVYCRDPQKICTETLNIIKELENKISWRVKESDIAKINSKNQNSPITISPETLDILDVSIKVSQATNSAFNPAILPLSKLWDFGGNNQRVPTEQEISNVLPYLNIQNLTLNKSACSVTKKDSKLMLDLGSIGKGTACDAAVNYYEDKKINAGIICVGGTIGVYGHKNDTTPWKIAIRNPFITDKTDVSFAVLDIDSGFISTSGAYERNFTYNDKFYHHILSSRTGYPIENNLASVTVYTSNGTLSDILSTACYVIGPDKSKSILKEFNAQALFVDKDKKVVASSYFKDTLNITDSSFVVSEWI